jgi:hypothetical protein
VGTDAEGETLKTIVQPIKENIMKKAALILLWVLCGTAAATDLVVGGNYLDCGKGTIYDTAWGVDLQARFPLDDHWMLGASIGYGQARMGHINSVDYCDWLLTETTDIGGDICYIPVGLSAIYLTSLFDCPVSLEAGLKYHFVDVDAARAETTKIWKYGGFTSLEEFMDQDCWTGSLGGNVELPITHNVSWQIGGGYQWRLGPHNVGGLDSALKGPFAKTGIIVKM